MIPCPACNHEMLFIASMGHNGVIDHRFYRCQYCEQTLVIPPLDLPPREVDPVDCILFRIIRPG